MENHRILIIGCCGSGKSTLTKVLAENFKLPVLHLDRVWHTTIYDEEGREILKQTQLDFMNKNERFIVDGNYSETLDLRIPYANLIIWLQVPRRVAMYRVISRSIKDKLRLEKRSDMAEEFEEKFDREYFEFLKYVWNFDKLNFSTIEAAVAKRNADCRLVVIRNKRDRKKLLRELVK